MCACVCVCVCACVCVCVCVCGLGAANRRLTLPVCRVSHKNSHRAVQPDGYGWRCLQLHVQRQEAASQEVRNTAHRLGRHTHHGAQHSCRRCGWQLLKQGEFCGIALSLCLCWVQVAACVPCSVLLTAPRCMPMLPAWLVSNLLVVLVFVLACNRASRLHRVAGPSSYYRLNSYHRRLHTKLMQSDSLGFDTGDERRCCRRGSSATCW